MKKVLLIFVFIYVLTTSGHVFAQVESSKTYDQMCGESDPNSKWNGDKSDAEGWFECDCKTGYQYPPNTTNERCVAVTPLLTTDTGAVEPTSTDWLTEPILSPKWQSIFFIIVCILLFIWLIIFLIDRYNEAEPDRAFDRKQREQAKQYEQLSLIAQQQANQQRRRILKDTEHLRLEQLCIDIRKLPKYKTWRKQVFDKWGYACEHCDMSSTETSLEIHHRKSLYSIVKGNSISDTYKAIECNQLWDVNNGTVLCKSCHDHMKSSEQRKVIQSKVVTSL